jgi:hypothetical protein
MLMMALQLKVVLVVVRLRSPRAQSIKVLSHRKELDIRVGSYPSDNMQDIIV